MKKVQIISDINKSSQKIKLVLINKIKKLDIVKSNITIVIGGDGFMLQTLKKNKNSKKFFYGINSGNYGFLMNKFSNKNFLKNFKSSRIIKIHPLLMKVKTKFI